MKVNGNITKFDYVRHYGMEGASRSDTMIVVWFDGDPETWLLEPNATIEQALGELEIYYRRDWKDSGRPTIPVKVYKLTEESTLKIDR